MHFQRLWQTFIGQRDLEVEFCPNTPVFRLWKCPGKAGFDALSPHSLRKVDLLKVFSRTFSRPPWLCPSPDRDENGLWDGLYGSSVRTLDLGSEILSSESTAKSLSTL